MIFSYKTIVVGKFLPEENNLYAEVSFSIYVKKSDIENINSWEISPSYYKVEDGEYK